MEAKKVLQQTADRVRLRLENEGSGHDWWHIDRVWKMSRRIAEQEGANLFICEMAALLHDLADDKLVSSEEEGLQEIRQWLTSMEVDTRATAEILEIITTMSFKGGNRQAMRTIEGQCVQDADRIDAIGAVGIARVFAFAGSRGQLIHDPETSPREQMTVEEYRKGSSAVNHFYEKLLKLKGLMNTKYGKELAEHRHSFMEQFLDEFYQEWLGKR